jgi:hypothetical protein
MKVTLATHGGLAAAIRIRRPPRVVDTETLPPLLSAELARLIAVAREAGSGEAAGAGGGARDAMTYKVTIEDGGTPVTLHSSDVTMTPAFDALRAWIEKHSAGP